MQSAKQPASSGREENPNLLVAIGASAGGLKEITKILQSLPEHFQGTIVIAVHRDPNAPNTLAGLLDFRARIEVVSPSDEESLECTTVYVGAPDERVKVDGREFDIEKDSAGNSRLTRIDDLFSSVAKSAGENSVGVVLSGMLWDGVAGLRAIDEAGGMCIVQDPRDASFDSMPKNALDAVEVDFVGTTEEIASRLMELGIQWMCHE